MDLGHGAGADGVEADSEHDWVIGDGNVHLWFVQLQAGEKTLGTEHCPADDLAGFFSETEIDGEHVGATEISSSFDGYPVTTRFIAGARCDLIGSEVTHTETYTATWTETLSCGTRYDIYGDWLDGGHDPDLPVDPDEIPDYIWE